jgi:cobalt transporter subunit CbtA
VIRHFLATALFAGILAGIAVTGIQQVTTVPLILQAEQYEAAAASPHADTHGRTDHSHDETTATREGGHTHDEGETWAPADGWERLFFTGLANVIAGTGFAFVLVACLTLWSGAVSGRTGVLWGLAGFAVFTLAPALGLPPELPATNAADLTARQVWWIGTAAATAIGLWLLIFPRKPLAAAGGIAALALPHLIGAPHLSEYSTVVPAELSAHFAAASIATSAIFWVCLGWLAGTFHGRKTADDGGLNRMYTGQPYS